VKFVPRHNQVIGRVVTKRILSSIVRPDETKNTTKFVLIDAVGSDAQAAGIKVGDIVLPRKMNHFVLDGGIFFRPIVDEGDIMVVVTDLPLDELVIQTDNGNQFVPIDHKDAAKNLCETAADSGKSAAA
jgi:hypothetical protein